MIEVPRGALTADEIAREADFFSFGTNDLTQMTFGYSRDDAEGGFLLKYVEDKILPVNPFQTLDDAVAGLMKIAVDKGRSTKPGLELGICGEHGGDPESIAKCERIGLDYVSCSPFRVPVARLAAAQAVLAGETATSSRGPARWREQPCPGAAAGTTTPGGSARATPAPGGRWSRRSRRSSARRAGSPRSPSSTCCPISRPRLRRARSRSAGSRTDADGTFVVDLDWVGPGEPIAGCDPIGALCVDRDDRRDGHACSTSHPTPRAASWRCCPGRAGGDGPFAGHGHTVRLVVSTPAADRSSDPT